MSAHLTLVAGLCLCAAAFWFELQRALGGNALSWAYVFEWPLLGAFATYAWWRSLNPSPRQDGAPDVRLSPEAERMRTGWELYQRALRAEAESDAAESPKQGPSH